MREQLDWRCNIFVLLTLKPTHAMYMVRFVWKESRIRSVTFSLSHQRYCAKRLVQQSEESGTAESASGEQEVVGCKTLLNFRPSKTSAGKRNEPGTTSLRLLFDWIVEGCCRNHRWLLALCLLDARDRIISLVSGRSWRTNVHTRATFAFRVD